MSADRSWTETTGNTGMSEDAVERGLKIRHDMFGPAGAEDAVAAASELAKPFHDMLSRYCFGEFWARPDLGRRDRSLITISMLIALGRENEVKMHVRGGMANGLTRKEIREVIMHAVPYCGVPAALGALRAAEEAMGGQVESAE
jgi:4-carboxymuconolactone decarboxylase